MIRTEDKLKNIIRNDIIVYCLCKARGKTVCRFIYSKEDRAESDLKNNLAKGKRNKYQGSTIHF